MSSEASSHTGPSDLLHDEELQGLNPAQLRERALLIEQINYWRAQAESGTPAPPDTEIPNADSDRDTVMGTPAPQTHSTRGDKRGADEAFAGEARQSNTYPCSAKKSRPDPTSASTAPKDNTTRSSAKTTSKPPPKLTGLRSYRFPQAARPSGSETLFRSIHAHLNLLIVLTANGVPVVPSKLTVDNWEKSHDPISALAALQDQSSDAVPAKGSYLPGLSQNLHVSNHVQRSCRLACTKVGFEALLPALNRPAYSPWNQAIRMVCLDTFNSATRYGTYNYISRDLIKWLDDLDLQTKIFDAYVFDHLAAIYRREKRQPGAAYDKKTLDAKVHRRITLCAKRAIHMVTDMELPRHWIDPIWEESKAHSDDECDTDSRRYKILAATGRSTCAEKLIRSVSADLQATGVATRRFQRFRIRYLPDQRCASPLTELAPNMPIDWWDPTWYNAQPASLRRYIAKPRIMFPPNPQLMMKRPVDPVQKMSEEELNEKYMKEVMSKYNYPAPDEKDAPKRAEDVDMDEEDSDNPDDARAAFLEMYAKRFGKSQTTQTSA